MREAPWQRQALQLAALYRWTAHWNGDSRRTVAGWPDLVLLGHDRALFIEMKKADGRVTKKQRETLDLLAAAGCEVAVLRPVDIGLLARVLGPRQERLPAWEPSSTGGRHGRTRDISQR